MSWFLSTKCTEIGTRRVIPKETGTSWNELKRNGQCSSYCNFRVFPWILPIKRQGYKMTRYETFVRHSRGIHYMYIYIKYLDNVVSAWSLTWSCDCESQFCDFFRQETKRKKFRVSVHIVTSDPSEGRNVSSLRSVALSPRHVCQQRKCRKPLRVSSLELLSQVAQAGSLRFFPTQLIEDS